MLWLWFYLAPLPGGLVTMVAGARFADKTRWGYAVMAAGIAAAVYGCGLLLMLGMMYAAGPAD